MKFLWILMFYVLIQVNFQAAEGLKINDACSTQDFLFGKISYVKDCDYVINLTRLPKNASKKMRDEMRKELNKVKKGKDHQNRIFVCCPENKGKIASEACNNFGKRPEEIGDTVISLENRIINGNPADAGEFPHFAALAFIVDQQLTFDCGGSLISDRFVLTAAHCCKSIKKPPVIVRLGKTSLNLGDENDPYEKVDIDVENLIIHPEYKPSQKYFDIALVKMKESVKFSYNIWPACLIPTKKIDETTKLTIAGFGRTDLKNLAKRSNWLLKATVSEIKQTTCINEYVNEYKDALNKFLSRGITDDMICAKNRRNKVDTCQGDSGSGLMLLNNDTFYVVGVTSFGVSCNTSLASFYTRVDSNIEWIEKTVWK